MYVVIMSHVYAFQSESTVFATQLNHLASLAKWLSVCLRTTGFESHCSHPRNDLNIYMPGKLESIFIEIVCPKSLTS